jgi:hypothetical protein
VKAHGCLAGKSTGRQPQKSYEKAVPKEKQNEKVIDHVGNRPGETGEC